MKWGLANDGMCLLCLASVWFFWLAVEHVIFQINVAIMHYFHRNNTCSVSDLSIGDPHRFRAGGKIRSGPQVGKLATSPLPYRGAPPLQSGGQNQKWPTSGQGRLFFLL